MPDLYYDFHIHSCLSPCGDDESTPANIAALAKMLELDAAALTDHNSCKNCPAFFKAAEQHGLLPIAGMELTTAEEIHVLCLFPELDNAMEFDKYVHEKLMPIENNTTIFGNQLIMDCDDNNIGTEKYCLINATSIDLYALSKLISDYDGIIIPTHIDRSSFSLIAALGFVPDDQNFDCVEIRYEEGTDNLKLKHPYLNKCRIIHDSDAHRLEDISLPQRTICVEEKSARGILRALSATYDKKYR